MTAIHELKLPVSTSPISWARDHVPQAKEMVTEFNATVVGPSFAGKSCLVGHLLVEGRALGPKQQELWNRHIYRHGIDSLWASDSGTVSKYLTVMHTDKDEREEGCTSHLHIAEAPLKTPKCSVTLIDCPGRLKSVRHLIKGAYQGDATICVVSIEDCPAPPPSKGRLPDAILSHLVAAHIMGSRRLIVCINKIDLIGDPAVLADRFFRFSEKLALLARKMFPKRIILPVSAAFGDNIFSRSPRTPWYEGPTLIEALDDNTMPARITRKTLSVSITHVFTDVADTCRPTTASACSSAPCAKPQTLGPIAFGTVKTGTLRVGDEVIIEPSGKLSTVLSIALHRQLVPCAAPGETVGIRLKEVTAEDLPSGCVIGRATDIQRPRAVTRFEAKIQIMPRTQGIRPGSEFLLCSHTASTTVKLVKVVTHNGKPFVMDPIKSDFRLKAGDEATVVFTVSTRRIVLTSGLRPGAAKPSVRIPMSTFLLMVNNVVAAVGAVLHLYPFRDKYFKELLDASKQLPPQIMEIVCSYVDDKDVALAFPSD